MDLCINSLTFSKSIFLPKRVTLEDLRMMRLVSEESCEGGPTGGQLV